MSGTIAAMQAAADKLDSWNLGYDQSNRWDIKPNGEADCSTSSGWIIKQGGYPIDLTGTFYTGNFAARAKAAGFAVLKFTSLAKVRPGDFLLTPGHHVVFVRSSTQVFSAEFDENGHATGGKTGDQTGRETRYRAPYIRPGGWAYIVRPPADVAPVPPVVVPPAAVSLLLGIANCQSYNGDKSAKAWTARGQLMKAQGRNAWVLCETSGPGREILLAVLGKAWREKVLAGKTVAVLYDSAVFSARTARPAGPWAPFGQGSLAVPLWSEVGKVGYDLIAHQTRPGSVATDAQKDHDIAVGAGLVRGWPAVFAGDFNRNDPHLPGWVRVLDGDTLDKPGSQRLDAAFTHGPITARNGKTIDPGPLSDHK